MRRMSGIYSRIRLGIMLSVLLLTACSAGTGEPSPESAESGKSLRFIEDPEAIRQKSGSVFIVEALDENGDKIAVGSGFLMFEADLLVTSAHVVTNAKTLRVYREQGDHITAAEAIAVDKEADTALYHLEKEAGTPLIPEEDTIKAEPVLAMGSAGGMMNLVTDGRLSAYHKTEHVSWLAFSAPVSPGESGGALFNAEGKVIGIIVGSVKDADCLNLAAPIGCAVSLYEKGK